MSKKKHTRTATARPFARKVIAPGFTATLFPQGHKHPSAATFHGNGLVSVVLNDTMLVMRAEYGSDYLCPLNTAEVVSDAYNALFGVKPSAKGLRTAMVGLALGTVCQVEFFDSHRKPLLGLRLPYEPMEEDYLACDFTDGSDPRVMELAHILAGAFSHEALLENAEREARSVNVGKEA